MINLYELLNVERDAPTKEVHEAIIRAEQTGGVEPNVLAAARRVLLRSDKREQYNQKLDAAAGRAEEKSSGITEQRVVTAGSFCTACGHPLLSQAAYCAGCGAKVGTPPPTRRVSRRSILLITCTLSLLLLIAVIIWQRTPDLINAAPATESATGPELCQQYFNANHRSSFKDPESIIFDISADSKLAVDAELRKTLRLSESASWMYLISVNAKNSFGGYTGGQPWQCFLTADEAHVVSVRPF